MKLGEIYNVNGTHYTVIAYNDAAEIATVVSVEKTDNAEKYFQPMEYKRLFKRVDGKTIENIEAIRQRIIDVLGISQKEKMIMEFYSLDVKSTVTINGKDIAFDYDNVYLNYEDAHSEAEKLKTNNDVLCVHIHKWVLLPDGTQEHTNQIPYSYTNTNHREMRK